LLAQDTLEGEDARIQFELDHSVDYVCIYVHSTMARMGFGPSRSKNVGKNVAPHHPDPKNLALNHPDPK
jgi:hypothetical protein